MGAGIAIGVALGAAMENIPIGIAIGIAIGAGMASTRPKKCHGDGHRGENTREDSAAEE